MKVAIVAPSSVPYVIGGAESFWWGLLEAFNNKKNIQADLIKLPCREDNLLNLLLSYRSFYLLDLNHFDCVVSSKYPAWALKHSNHIVYMQHPCRILYDQYPGMAATGLDDDILAHLISFAWPQDLIEALIEISRPSPVLLPIHRSFLSLLNLLIATCEHDPNHVLWQIPGPLSRAIIRLIDQICLSHSRVQRYAAISQTVANREAYFPKGVSPEVLYHPTSLIGFENHPPKHIFSASRLVSDKRIDLLIDAYRASGVSYPLKIAGVGPLEASLRAQAEDLPTVEFMGRLSNQQLVQAYSEALFVPFIPINEDYGLITVEAMSAQKPVLTVSDAGGPVELVVNQKNGWVVSPNSQDLAEAIQVACDPTHPVYEQINRQQSISKSYLSWDELAESLLNEVGGKFKASQYIKVTVMYSRDLVNAKKSFSALLQWVKLIDNYVDVQFCSFSSEVDYLRDFISGTHIKEMIVPLPKMFMDKVHEFERAHANQAMSKALAQYSHKMLLSMIKPIISDSDAILFSDPELFSLLRATELPLIFYPQHCILEAANDSLPVTFVQLMSNLERQAYTGSSGILMSHDCLPKYQDNYGVRDDLVLIPRPCSIENLSLDCKEKYRKEWEVSRPCVLLYLPLEGMTQQQIESLIFMVGALPFYDFVAIGQVVNHVKIPENLIFLNDIGSREHSNWLKIAHLAVISKFQKDLLGFGIEDVMSKGVMLLEVVWADQLVNLPESQSELASDLVIRIRAYLNQSTEQQSKQLAAAYHERYSDDTLGSQIRSQLNLIERVMAK